MNKCLFVYVKIYFYFILCKSMWHISWYVLISFPRLLACLSETAPRFRLDSCDCRPCIMLNVCPLFCLLSGFSLAIEAFYCEHSKSPLQPMCDLSSNSWGSYLSNIAREWRSDGVMEWWSDRILWLGILGTLKTFSNNLGSRAFTMILSEEQ